MRGGTPRWRAAGWLGAHLPDVRGRDRVVGLVRGRKAGVKPGPITLVNGLVFDAGEAVDGSIDSLCELQYRKPALAPVIEHFARPGAVIYDVGANIGLYALWAARRVGPGGQVHAFEPVAATARLLRRFVEANGATNVRVAELALGRAPGTATMFCVPGASGLASTLARPGATRTEVRCTTLDDYARGHDPPTFIKVDVEGAEPEVVAGGLGLLARSKPSLLLETNPAPGDATAASTMLETLDRLGYSVYNLTRRGLQAWCRPPTHNVLALDVARPEHRRAFEALRCVHFPRNQTT